MGASLGYMSYTVNQNLLGFGSSDTDTHTHSHVQSLKFTDVLHIQSIFYSHKEQDKMFWEHDGCKTVNMHAHGQQETVSFEETVVTV